MPGWKHSRRANASGSVNSFSHNLAGAGVGKLWLLLAALFAEDVELLSSAFTLLLARCSEADDE